MGETGPRGYPGPPGLKGIKGEDARCEIHLKGQKGEPGRDGVTGQAGNPGSEGPTGLPGTQGEQGIAVSIRNSTYTISILSRLYLFRVHEVRQVLREKKGRNVLDTGDIKGKRVKGGQSVQKENRQMAAGILTELKLLVLKEIKVTKEIVVR